VQAELTGYKVTNKAKPDFGNADLHQVERLQFSDFSVETKGQPLCFSFLPVGTAVIRGGDTWRVGHAPG